MDQKEKTDIRSLNLKELTVFMEQLGEKAFRAIQTWQFGLYFFTGGMPHGMPILRIYIGRSRERTDPI